MAGAELNARDARKWTPLHHAVDANQPEIVDLLSAKGASLNSRNEAGKTPLAMARDAGRLGLVESLLNNGAHDPPQASAATPAATQASTPVPATNAWRDVRETGVHAPSIFSHWGRSDNDDDDDFHVDSEPVDMDDVCSKGGLSVSDLNWRAEPANIEAIENWKEGQRRFQRSLRAKRCDELRNTWD